MKPSSENVVVAGQFLLDLETRERARTGIANLRVEYNRVHGFYIEVTNAQAGNIALVSQSGALTNAILESAKAAGADCVMVACPLCHANLDIRQKEIEAAINTVYNMPVLYMTQLLALAVWVRQSKLGLDSMIVNPLPLLKEKNLI